MSTFDSAADNSAVAANWVHLLVTNRPAGGAAYWDASLRKKMKTAEGTAADLHGHSVESIGFDGAES